MILNIRLFKNYQKLLLERDVQQKTVDAINQKLNKLIGGPKDVKAVDYSYKSESSNHNTNCIPTLEQLELIQMVLGNLKFEQAYLDILNTDIKEIEERIEKYVNENKNDIEVKLFHLHYVKRVKLCDISLKKENRRGYYSYVQLKKINKRIREQLESDESFSSEVVE